MARILAIRLSAFGDAAMTVPVIDSFARTYPEHEVVILSQHKFQALFAPLPSNVSFYGVDSKTELRSLGDLWRLYLRLRKMNFTHIADLHDVLRSKLLRTAFAFQGCHVAHIDKERKKRRALTRQKHKRMERLVPMFVKHQAVFSRLNFPFELNYSGYFSQTPHDVSLLEALSLPSKLPQEKWIGIAPFAQHQGKLYPLEQMRRVVAALASNSSYRLFLFAAGGREEGLLRDWIEHQNNIFLVAGKLSLEGELTLMSQLDVMLSMDSANMHLASLVNTPVISVWGATHPFAGFMGWQQKESNAIQTDLTCRPCSIFGNKPCYRGDYACLCQIEPEHISTQIETFLRERQ